MAEVTQVEPNQEIPENNDAPTTEPTTEPTIEEQIAEVEARLSDKFKTEISGLNRRNSDLEKKLSESEKAKMTDDERIKAELEEAKAEVIAERQEKETLLQGKIIDSELSSVGLPLSFAKYIRGEDEPAIKGNVKELNDLIVDTANKLKEADINTRLSGKGPIAGKPSDVTNLQAAYDQAKKSGNDALKLAIKRKATAQGETIT